MLDQMFTPENFRRIYDEENRKGVDLASRFFHDLAPYTQGIHDLVKELKDWRSLEAGMGSDVFTKGKETLKSKLSLLKLAKSAAVDAKLENVSARVIEPNFRIALRQLTGPEGKKVYTIDGTAETFFAINSFREISVGYTR